VRDDEANARATSREPSATMAGFRAHVSEASAREKLHMQGVAVDKFAIHHGKFQP
jgi:hypothetical protein